MVEPAGVKLGDRPLICDNSSCLVYKSQEDGWIELFTPSENRFNARAIELRPGTVMLTGK